MINKTKVINVVNEISLSSGQKAKYNIVQKFSYLGSPVAYIFLAPNNGILFSFFGVRAPL